MKIIEPVSVWVNGVSQEATLLLVNCNGDNLKDSAYFSYQLMKPNDNVGPMSIPGDTLVSGGLSMSGEAYNNWETNDYAYDWVAQQLNLTITGEYVPPTYNVEQTEV